MRRLLSITVFAACALLAACNNTATKASGSVLAGQPTPIALPATDDGLLASDGAKQGFTVACVGTEFVLAQVQGIAAISADQKAGIGEADSIIHGICDGGPPTSAFQLALTLGKVAIEDQYLRALVAKALGG